MKTTPPEQERLKAAFEPLSIPEGMEVMTGAKTLFYGRLGSNTVWGFKPEKGEIGVAVTDGQNGQAVISVNNLQELCRMLTRHTPSVEGGVKGLRTGQELMEDYYFQSGGKDRSWDFVGWLDSIQREAFIAGQKSSGEMVGKLSRLLREVRLLWETRGILHSKTSRRVFSDIDNLLFQLESKGEV